MTFDSKRVTHEYVQNNAAPPEKVFPLLCPVREAEWVPGWEYRLVYSRSGVAERGCVFTTPNPDASESTWVVTEYAPQDFRIGFVWVWPEMVATEIAIRLESAGENATRAHICYTYTGLSPAGNEEVARYDAGWFQQKMTGWEAAINHYLRTGKKLAAGAWE